MASGSWSGRAGGDIRSAIVPMTFPGADSTLFELLGLLIEAGKEVASITGLDRACGMGERERGNPAGNRALAAPQDARARGKSAVGGY